MNMCFGSMADPVPFLPDLVLKICYPFSLSDLNIKWHTKL